MGRETRRVAPNWDHPKTKKPNIRTGTMDECYKPLYDRSCEEAWAEWQSEFAAWQNGEHDRIIAEYGAEDYPKDQPYLAFCGWHGTPPEPEYYRPQWAEGLATWWQVYETVSEGTPVSPPFETQDELIDYLVENGDFWDQKRRQEGDTVMNNEPWSRKQAEAFVRGPGWAPSFVVDSKGMRSGVKTLADD